MMDGDDLGKWLRGDLGPVDATVHAALSGALANYALHEVPPAVEGHGGTVIYAGGDDTLAVLPAARALACALALERAYRQPYGNRDGHDYLLMGGRATLSAGLAVVHYKEDLRSALDWAREAERRAKQAGKDALGVTVCRRSGEHAFALCPWDFAAAVAGWVDHFRAGASDRWAYHLAADLPTLEGLDAPAHQAEVRRQLGRAEEPTRRRFPPAALARTLAEYHAAVRGRPGLETAGQAFRAFVTLCQSASFLARGRDQ
jgi:CRISPR-associated protein Cmr2